ncbi:S-adenosyl-L-methionine-dependent methyltransferase [Tricladium varicosporioides]|nr:S-adenosyl-L-methionine-dependent methyltransferase [Hymenoscyphus varicosporioides]
MATPTSRPIQLVSTEELYNRWAKVYDSDGNILQALDDLMIPSLLSKAFDLLFEYLPTGTPITITELGAGTSRNTYKLVTPPLSAHALYPAIIQINALDLSTSMLDIAQSRLSTVSSPAPNIDFYEFDALSPGKFPEAEKLYGQANMVLSTLVLEHLPLDIFFSTVQKLLKESGLLVMSNFAAEMARRSRAGFLDISTNTKVQGESYIYEISEVVEAAEKVGFEVLGEVSRRGVSEHDVREGVVGERGVKWVGVECWMGCVMRLRKRGV